MLVLPAGQASVVGQVVKVPIVVVVLVAMSVLVLMLT